MEKFLLQDYGEDVQYVIDKVQALVESGGEDATLFTSSDKAKLDALGVAYDTTEHWNEKADYIPEKGVIVIYSDYKTLEKDGETINVPGIKVGSGNAYLADLAFLGIKTEIDLLNHIADTIAHTTKEEKSFWNRKLNVDDAEEVIDETLIFNRN